MTERGCLRQHPYGRRVQSAVQPCGGTVPLGSHLQGLPLMRGLLSQPPHHAHCPQRLVLDLQGRSHVCECQEGQYAALVRPTSHPP